MRRSPYPRRMTSIRLAVVPGRRHRPRGGGRGPQGARGRPRPGAKVETDRVRPGRRAATTRTGEVAPDAVLEELRGHDAILLGAVGDPTRPAGRARARPAAAAALRARPPRQPAAGRGSTPGVPRPLAGHARETSTWSSSARAPRARTPAPVAPCAAARRTRSRPRRASTPRTASSASSATPSPGRSARPRQKLTLVHKTNVLTYAGGLWQRTSTQVARGVPRGHAPTTATSTPRRCSSSPSPQRFDVIVTDNMFGDIITDLGAAVAGGIGLAASGNLDVEPDQPEHVRAGPRLRPGHRRPGHGRPDRRRSCRWRCCSTTSGRPRPRPPGRGGGGRRPRRARARRRAARRGRRRARRTRSGLTPSPGGGRPA